MLSYRLNPAGLTLTPLSRRVSQASMRRIAACFLITLFVAGCETKPFTPAPIKEQSLSLPKESEKVKLETTVKTDTTVKPASPSAPDSSSPASSASSKQTIQSVPPVDPTPILNWVWPTDLPIAQPFSDARKGVDFSGPAGQPVKAVANGIASYLGSSLRGYGQMVVIKHDEGFISVYANNSKILVKEGQKIEKGQKIAETGHADGSDLALHFELRQQGKPLDPIALFPQRN
jgi:lipoprotein NlpD